jgi:GNAT superfamily N-acetyltransferase
MKKIEVHNRCSDFDSYRAARVKSLFNAESGCNFDLVAELPADETWWRIGLIVGPSGSGKSSIGKQFWEGETPTDLSAGWPADRPVVDAIAPDGDFNAVTSALASVGLGDVPSWLRPFHVLSVGEKFRAGAARVLSEAPERVIIDEFTSALDRQVARFGAMAFAKSWRRLDGGRQCLLLSCHRDIVEWIQPDWIFDTATGKYSSAVGVQRPRFQLDIYKTGWHYWPFFEKHHYLKLPNMIAACCYVGAVDGEPVCHLAVSCRNKGTDVEARACRLVVLPEWQGAGVGLRFLNAICEMNLRGEDGARLPGRPVTTMFHTSHPGLAAALRRDRKWRQVSAVLYGASRLRYQATIRKSNERKLKRDPNALTISGGGYGGHFRAVQGFRYVGEVEG